MQGVQVATLHRTTNNQKMRNTTINTGINKDGSLQPQITTTRYNGTLEERYNCYLQCADNGKGGDWTRNGEPLLSFDEWLNG